MKNKRTLQSKFRKQRTKCRVRLCAYVHAQHMGRAARWLCSGVFISQTRNRFSVDRSSIRHLRIGPQITWQGTRGVHVRAKRSARTRTTTNSARSAASRRRRAAKAKERRRGGSCITRRRSSLRIHFCVVRRGPRSIDGRPYLTGSHGQHTDWPIRALTTTGARWSPVGRKPLPAAHRSTCAPPAPAILNPSRRHLLFPSEGGRARRLEPKTG